MKPIVLALICSLYTYSAFSQKTVSGKVFSAETRQYLPGVSIKFKTHQSLTDKSGSFSFILLAPDTLKVSFVGYETTLIYLDNKTTLSDLKIQLKPATLLLNEVVVATGYQKIPRERATGSFVVINQELFNQQTGTTVLERLPNIAGSVSLDRRTSTAGNLSVRGISTIQGPRSPLIILDNFPYQGDLSNINPNDVESITILKDAAAASIWGAKAGNGVIVITTKKGTFNKPLNVEWNTNLTVAAAPDLFKLKQISATDLIDVEQLLFANGKYEITNSATALLPVTPVIELLRKKKAGTIDPVLADQQIDSFRSMDVRDQFNKYFYQSAVNQQYALRLNAGNESLAWKSSLGYDHNRNELDAGYERINLNTSASIRPFKNLEIAANINITKSSSVSGKPGYGDIMMSEGEIPVYSQFADADGNALPLAKGYALEYLEQAGNGKLLDWKYYPLEDYKHSTTNSTIFDLLTDINANYKFTDYLSAGLFYRYQRSQSDANSLNDLESYFARDIVNNFTQINAANGAVLYRVPPGGILDFSNTLRPIQNLRGKLNFNKQWNRNRVNVLAGIEFSEDKSLSNSYRTYGYDQDILTFGQVDYTSQYPQFATGTLGFIPTNAEIRVATNRYASAYINASYSYDDRYTFSLSARRDGSNLFGVLPNNKFNPLGSVGLSWDVSKERFFTTHFIDYLKFRATYGYSGNTDQGRTAYSTITYWGTSTYTLTPYAKVTNFANPELRWEKVGLLNLGMDFKILDSRISGSLEYYQKLAKDLFGTAQIDYTGGAGATISKNTAKMKAEGVDLELNTLNLSGKVKWTSQLNLTWYKDKILQYYSTALYGNRVVGNNNPTVSGLIGKPVYGIFSYPWEGLDPLTGDPQGNLDGAVSKDYTKITGTGTPLSDMVFHGSALPTWFGNLRNTFGYGKLSLVISLNFKFGYYLRKQSLNYNNLYSSRSGHADFSSRWQQPGDEKHTSIPSMVYPADANRDVFYNNSAINVIKGDHIRLQFVTVGYDINKKDSKWLPFKRANVYMNMNNLGLIYTANKYKIDPDYRESNIPATMNIAFGIRAEF